jgi:hypothetical protein
VRPHLVHRVTDRGTLPGVSTYACVPGLSLMNRQRLGTGSGPGTRTAGVDR